MLRKFFFIYLISLLITSCSGEDQENPSTNSVFAFFSSDKNVSISNQGLNAVINVSAFTSEYELPIKGNFINAVVYCDCNWVKATIEDKKLHISISVNYSDNIRSMSFSVKANNTEEIVIANIAVNQAILTDEEKVKLEELEIQYVLKEGGGVKPIPDDLNLELKTWYPLNNEGNAYFRVYGRIPGKERIQLEDIVYPNYSVSTIDNAMNGGSDWWKNTIADNHHSNKAVTVFSYPSQQQIGEFGLGILLPLTKGLFYGDDVDVLLGSSMGLPSLKNNRSAYIYVVQYNEKPAAGTPSAINKD